MNTLAERLLSIRESLGFTQEQLAKKVGISQNAIQKIESGITQKPRNILLIAKALEVDPVWLQTGEGEMQPNANVEWLDNSKDYSDTHIEIDLYDIKLSAGNGKPVIEWIPHKAEEPILLSGSWFKRKRINPECCKAMLVRGQSMYPVLEDWDIVIVDISDQDIIDGEVYALVYKNNFYIKQVIRSSKGVSLVSFNPDYEPIEIEEKDLSYLQIIGRKIWRGG